MTQHSSTGCVVIVDDDALDRKFIADSFAKVSPGVEIIEIADPRTALAEITRAMPDLALLDIAMPQIDGFQVLRAFRADIDAVDPAPSPPIVMLSNSNIESEIKMSLELGATEYRVKPSTVAGYHALAAELSRIYLSLKAA